jgi:hypothetical protein
MQFGRKSFAGLFGAVEIVNILCSRITKANDHNKPLQPQSIPHYHYTVKRYICNVQAGMIFLNVSHSHALLQASLLRAKSFSTTPCANPFLANDMIAASQTKTARRT